MTNCLDALLAQKELLQAELPKLLVAASPEQADALRAAYARARQNWNEAANKSLGGGDEAVAGLVGQMQVAHGEIEESCRKLDDVAGTIGKITTGAEIGSKLMKFLV